jgi:hypothetical protein
LPLKAAARLAGAGLKMHVSQDRKVRSMVGRTRTNTAPTSASRRLAPRAVLLMAAALFVVASGSGCTFYLLDGNGPKPLSAYHDELPSPGAERLAEWKEEAHERSFLVGRLSVDERGDLRGYELHYRSTPFWPVLAGPFHVRKHWEPKRGREGRKRTLIGKEDAWGFLSPLFVTGKGSIYDERTRQCVAREKITFVTLLMIFHSRISPAEGMSEFTDAGARLDEVMYDEVSSWSLGWGLLAAGSKNRRAYLQLFWIPIPLWSLE